MAKRNGRPTAITAERTEQIVRYIETLGAKAEEACLLTGITPRVFYQWQAIFLTLTQNAKDEAVANRPLPRLSAREQEVEAFFMEVHTAETRLRLRVQGALLKAALGQERIDPIYENDPEAPGGKRLVRAGQEGRIGDWRAAARVLETLDTERWGRRVFVPSAEVEEHEFYALNVPPPMHLRQLQGKVEVPPGPGSTPS